MDKKPSCQRVHGHKHSGTANGSVHLHCPFPCEASRPQQLLILIILQTQVQICAVAHTGAKLNKPLSDQSKPSEMFHVAFTPAKALYCSLTWPGQIESLRGDVCQLCQNKTERRSHLVRSDFNA